MPRGHSASLALNNVECWDTKKINIIFFGLAAGTQLPHKSKNKRPGLFRLFYFLKIHTINSP